MTMASTASMASFALNQRQQDKENSYSNGNNGDGKIWAYEAEQVTGSLKKFLIFPSENKLGFHMKYRLFLH